MRGQFILLAIVGLFFSGAAWAESIEGAANWTALDAAAKRGYVMGVMDKTLSIDEEEKEIGGCIKDVSPQAADVVALVDQKYADPDLATIPGYIVIYRSVYEICFPYISKADPNATAPSVYWQALKTAAAP